MYVHTLLLYSITIIFSSVVPGGPAETMCNNDNDSKSAAIV